VQRYKWLQIVDMGVSGEGLRNGPVLGTPNRDRVNSMSTKANTQQESTDPRDDYIHIGIDTHDASHVYRTKDETVLVIEDGRIAYRHDLDERSVNEWLDYVTERRGWESRQLYKGMASALFSSVE